MKIIITKRFREKFINSFGKYFSEKNLIQVFKSKNHNFISIHHPFLKFKSKINFVEFRWIIYIENTYIIPLCMFLKKDKKYWNNLAWKTHKKLIKIEFELSVKNIEKWIFDVFE